MSKICIAEFGLRLPAGQAGISEYVIQNRKSFLVFSFRIPHSAIRTLGF
jgi:hypothetical protein